MSPELIDASDEEDMDEPEDIDELLSPDIEDPLSPDIDDPLSPDIDEPLSPDIVEEESLDDEPVLLLEESWANAGAAKSAVAAERARSFFIVSSFGFGSDAIAFPDR